MARPDVLFVDSDAFIALAKQDDSNHGKAESILAALEKREVVFATSNYVFSEVVTVLSQRVGKGAALSFIRAMRSPASRLSWYWVDSSVEENAIHVFEKQFSKNISFVDCVNMALLAIHGIVEVFSFDQVYRKNGFRLCST